VNIFEHAQTLKCYLLPEKYTTKVAQPRKKFLSMIEIFLMKLIRNRYIIAEGGCKIVERPTNA
jgi:hypothetical protein